MDSEITKHAQPQTMNPATENSDDSGINKFSPAATFAETFEHSTGKRLLKSRGCGDANCIAGQSVRE